MNVYRSLKSLLLLTKDLTVA
jgi:hypothetical protein